MSENKHKCIICGSEDLEEYNALPHPFLVHRMFEGKHFEKEALYRCKDCGIYFSSFRPNKEENDRYYKNYMEEEYIKDRTIIEPNFEQRRHEYNENNGYAMELQIRKSMMKKMFSRYIDFSKIEKVLDYGGARGEFIIDEFKNAQKYVYDVDTIEPINNEIKKITKSELTKNKFDFIQCCHTLEHVSYPMDLVAEMISVLKLGGYLYIEVPFEDSFINKIMQPNSTFLIHEHINIYRTSVFESIFYNPNFVILENKIIDQSALFGQTKIISCLVKYVEPTDTVTILNKMHALQSYIEKMQDKNSVEYQLLKGLTEQIFNKQNDEFNKLNENINDIITLSSESAAELKTVAGQITQLEQKYSDLNSLIHRLMQENEDIKKILHNYISKPTFLQQIFSVRNEGLYKVVRILRIKIKFRRKNDFKK